ncbi:MAG: oligosaccharide flippase family protein [Colwellia sp.]|nr:oligosaccharide flippase family protein [Colwellia sp.]
MSNQLKTNISWLALMKISSYLLPLLTLPYLTNVLGLELFGVLAIGMAIQQIIFSLCDYGFSLLGPKLVAENLEDKKLLGQIVTAITLIKLAIFCIVYLGLYYLLPILKIPKQNAELWLLMLWVSLLQVLIPVWFFLGIQKMANVTFVNIFERLLYTSLIFLMIDSAADLQLIPMLMIASMSLALFVSCLLVKRAKVVPLMVELSLIKSLFIQGWGYFYSRLTMMLFSKFNVIIVASFLGESAAGVFSLAERIYNAARSMMAPVTDALYPHMVQTKNWPLALKIIKYASLFAVSCVFISFMLSGWFFSLFGDGFSQAADIFNILMYAFAFSLISMLIGYPVLGVVGFAKEVNNSVLYGALQHGVVIFVLWQQDLLSGYSLAISLVLTEVFIFGYRIFYINQSKVFSGPLKVINECKGNK